MAGGVGHHLGSIVQVQLVEDVPQMGKRALEVVRAGRRRGEQHRRCCARHGVGGDQLGFVMTAAEVLVPGRMLELQVVRQ